MSRRTLIIGLLVNLALFVLGSVIIALVCHAFGLSPRSTIIIIIVWAGIEFVDGVFGINRYYSQV